MDFFFIIFGLFRLFHVFNVIFLKWEFILDLNIFYVPSVSYFFVMCYNLSRRLNINNIMD
jgi:hypothetical protein